MKKIIAVAAAVLTTTAVAAPVAGASMSASAVTKVVQRSYTTQVRNNAVLAGYRFEGSQVRCRAAGGNQFNCYATYTLGRSRFHARYGIYINVLPSGRWQTTSTRAQLLRAW